MNKLCTLVAYYPARLPKDLSIRYPPSLDVSLHLVGPPLKVLKNVRTFLYPHVEAGFAESGLESYDKLSSNIAWSRTLGVVRKGFEIEVDLEKIWDEHLARKRIAVPT